MEITMILIIAAIRLRLWLHTILIAMQGKIEIRDTFEGQQEQLMEVITMLFHPVKMIAMTKTIQTIPVMKKI